LLRGILPGTGPFWRAGRIADTPAQGDIVKLYYGTIGLKSKSASNAVELIDRFENLFG
jgi:hypothetical protein